jgi:hypothetical protein
VKNIITAWAEPAVGPGWSNFPIWYIWRDGNGKLHQDCIQPADQTAPMLFLYETSAAVSKQMKTAVEAALEARLQESKK